MAPPCWRCACWPCSVASAAGYKLTKVKRIESMPGQDLAVTIKAMQEFHRHHATVHEMNCDAPSHGFVALMLGVSRGSQRGRACGVGGAAEVIWCA
jgi:hypothetical protein